MKVASIISTIIAGSYGSHVISILRAVILLGGSLQLGLALVRLYAYLRKTDVRCGFAVLLQRILATSIHRNDARVSAGKGVVFPTYPYTSVDNRGHNGS